MASTFFTAGDMEGLLPRSYSHFMRKKVGLPGVGNSIRAWRIARNLTLERLVERLREDGQPITAASLSRIERGEQPYSQPILEALARALQTEPASLIMRTPPSKEQIELYSLIEGMDDTQRKRTIGMLKAAFAA